MQIVGPANAPAVLFLPGIGSAAESWSEIALLLPEFRCLLVDLPGHGDSRDIPWRSFEDAAHLVLETVGPDVHHIVGLSQGAYLASHVIALAPQQFDTALISGLQPRPIAGAWKYKILMDLMAPLMKIPALLRKNALAMGVPSETLDGYVEGARKTRLASFRRAFSDAMAYSIPKNFERVDARVLVAAGEKENSLILEGQAAFKEALPSSKAIRIAGLGHVWPLQNPALFALVLSAHISDLSFPDGVAAV